jgi:hypothetical protein
VRQVRYHEKESGEIERSTFGRVKLLAQGVNRGHRNLETTGGQSSVNFVLIQEARVISIGIKESCLHFCEKLVEDAIFSHVWK